MGDFGPFRPLKPYTEAERALFFGRERELAELSERLTGDRPSALLHGPSGIGKTSVVRAGLLPALKSRGVACGYVDGGVLDDAQLPATSGAAGALLVIDDVGAALDDGPRLDRLLSILQRAGTVRGMRILFVIDDDDLWRLDSLERRVGSIAGVSSRVRLGPLDEARVGDLLERTVLGGGAYFEAGLSREIAVDVCKQGDVSPSLVQLVAATAVALHLNSLKGYRRSGGAEVLTWRYFERAIARVPATGQRAAARLLAELAAAEPREVVTRDALARAAGVDEASADRLATVLAGEHLLRRDGDAWTLSSEWLRPLARAYTGEARGRGVAARLLMRRKLDGGGLLSIGAVREVRRFAGTLAPDEETLVKRSVQVGLAVSAAILAIPIAATVALYGSYGRSYYLDAGPGPGASVVARLGRGAQAMTSLPHRPAFGSVIADSGFARAALAGELPDGAGPRGGDDWLRRIAGALKPLPHGAVALVLDGDVKPLEKAYADAALRPAVVGAIGAAGRGGPDEVQLLERALSDGAEDVRRRAVEAAAQLERRKPGASTTLLAAGLRDASPAVRALALGEIERLPDEQSAPLLAQALAQSSDPVVRRSALDAIAAQVARTPSAAAKLGAAMLGPARAEASGILGHLVEGSGPAADAAAQALSDVALNAKAPEDARIEALRMLRRREQTPAGLKDINGSPKLMAAAMPLQVRGASAEDAQAKVAEAMKGPAPLRAAAAAAIGLLPKTADTPKQLKVLQYDTSVEVHAEAVRALPVLGREALPLLVKEAKGSGAEVEKAAVETIGAQSGKLGVSSAAQALESVVKGARPTTRKAAIEALGRMAEQKPALAASALGRLVRDKAPDVRADAAGALGDVLAHGGKEAVAALKAVAKDPDPSTRRRAAGALGRAKGPLVPQAAKALAVFASDPEAAVRIDVAQALGMLGAGAREGAPLAALIADKDPSVRSAARKAAQQVGGGADLDKVLLSTFAGAPASDRVEIAATAGMVGAVSTVRAALADPDAMVRRAAAEHASGGGPALQAALQAALGDVDTAVRVSAVRGLVGAHAGEALAQAARSPDRDVRTAALEALGDVGQPQAARPALEAALSDASERVRAAAVRGLAQVASPSSPARDASAAELLEKALRDPARDVRAAAVAGLGQAWSSLPPSELQLRLADEVDSDRRYAAALALARQAGAQNGAEALHVLEGAAKSGTPGVKLAAEIARAFVGRADAMAGFLRLVRDGA